MDLSSLSVYYANFPIFSFDLSINYRRGLLGLVTDCTSSYGTRNLEAFYYTYIGAIGRIRGLAALVLPGRKWAERSGDCPLTEFACMYATFRRECALLHDMV